VTFSWECKRWLRGRWRLLNMASAGRHVVVACGH
jgi:hypothetical protein